MLLHPAGAAAGTTAGHAGWRFGIFQCTAFHYATCVENFGDGCIAGYAFQVHARNVAELGPGFGRERHRVLHFIDFVVGFATVIVSGHL